MPRHQPKHGFRMKRLICYLRWHRLSFKQETPDRSLTHKVFMRGFLGKVPFIVKIYFHSNLFGTLNRSYPLVRLQIKKQRSYFTMTKTFFTLAAAMIMAGTLSACNTVEGAGEDIHNAGSAVSETAREVDREMN